MYKLIIVFFILAVFLLLKKSYEGFNILDYQFGEKNKPLYVNTEVPTSKPLLPIFEQENDPWVVKSLRDKNNLKEPVIYLRSNPYDDIIKQGIINPLSIEDQERTRIVTARNLSVFIPAPTVSRVVVQTESPKPKLIDYQFSEFNFPSNPINKMKLNSYAPWSSVKQIDRYIIPQSVTPYAINLYSDYISK